MARGASSVLVVPATESGNPGDRAYVARMARRLGVWLESAGVPTRRADEGEFREGTPAGRVAMIVAPANVDAELLRGYGRFIRKGGRLVVFYGSSEGLAELMGLRLGEYVADSSGERFARMSFGTQRPLPIPRHVDQRSRNIRVVRPQAAGTRVLAAWHDSKGNDTGQPAWLAGPRGFWMTHVLLPDGSDASRQALLLGLVAECDPALWAGAAKRRIADARAVLHGREPFARLDALLGRMAAGSSRTRAARLVASARGLSETLDGGALGRDPKGTWQRAADLETAVVDAFGALQSPGPASERCGVWERTGEGPFPGNWQRSCRLLAAAGVTDLFVHVLSPGYSHFPGGVWPQSATSLRMGDPLKQCLVAAKSNGIRVHAWVMAWPTEGASEALLGRWRRDGRLTLDTDGKERPWLEPSDPRNRRELCKAIADLVSRYDVDGVHLDYIRYPDGRSGYGAANRRRFTALHGAPSEWPRSAWIGAESDAYRQWKVSQITSTVGEVRRAVDGSRKGVVLSAAVYGGYPQCVEGVAQDWYAWLRSDRIDFVCPMNYTPSLIKFQGYLTLQLAGGRRQRIWPGIGVHANESVLGPVETIEQIQATRRAGSPGFVLYGFDRYVAETVLPVLSLGATGASR